jgi:hypothetical protein
MGEIMGRAMNLTYNRRCDFCHRPVKFGYIVNTGPTQGFFCGRLCLERATKHMADLKREKGIK